MHTDRSRSRHSLPLWRTLAGILAAFALLFGSAAASMAAEDPAKPIDASTIPDVRKPQVAASIRDKVAHDYCSQENVVTPVPWEVQKDVDPGSAKFAKCRDHVLSVLPTGFDELVPYTTAEGRNTACQAGGPLYIGPGIHDFSQDFGYRTQWCGQAEDEKASQAMDAAWRDFWTGVIGSGGVAAVDFVSNPKDSTEKLANQLKTDSTSALAAVINDASRATDFDPNADWFRTQWAAFGGIGILVLAFMVMRTVRDYGDGKITAEEATHAIVGFGPLGLVLVLFGPPLGHFLNVQITGLTQGIIKFTAGSLLAFANATDFSGVTSGGVFGPVAGIILFGLLLLGCWSVLVLFVVQSTALGLIGAGLAVAIGFIVHPLWRKRAVTMGATYLGIALSKPLLFLILGFVMAMIGAQSPVKDGTDDALANGLKILTVGLILATIGFSPATLFKYMPLLPKGGDSVQHHSSGAGRAFLSGAAGGMMSNRMFRNSSRAGGGQRSEGRSFGGGSTSQTGGGPSPIPDGVPGGTGGAAAGGTTTGGTKAGGNKGIAPAPGSGGGSGQAQSAGTSSPGPGQDQGRRAQSAVRKAVGNTVPAVTGTSKVAAGVALKAALAAANAAATSARSQAHDHAPSFD